MKKIAFFALFTCFIIWSYCHQRQTTEPLSEDDRCQQIDITWPSLADSPWPMYHHDPQATGRSQYKGPRKGKVKWTFKPGGNIDYSFAIGPDSIIYFPTCNEGEKHTDAFYALRPDGTLKWRLEINVGQAQPMILQDGTILIVGGQRQFYFIHPDGYIIKSIDLGITISAYLNIGIDGTIYFVGGESDLYAMSQNGTVLWTVSLARDFYASNFPISPDGSTIYIFSRKNYFELDSLYAISTTDGEIIWQLGIENRQNSRNSPLIDSYGNIFWGTWNSNSSKFYSHSAGGSLNWTFAGWIFGTPTIDKNSNIYFQIGYEKWLLTSCDYVGNLRWQNEISPGFSDFICDNEGVVYVISETEATAHTSNGEKLWSLPLKGRITRIAEPAIGVDGTLYFGTFEGPEISAVYAIE